MGKLCCCCFPDTCVPDCIKSCEKTSNFDIQNEINFKQNMEFFYKPSSEEIAKAKKQNYKENFIQPLQKLLENIQNFEETLPDQESNIETIKLKIEQVKSNIQKLASTTYENIQEDNKKKEIINNIENLHEGVQEIDNLLWKEKWFLSGKFPEFYGEKEQELFELYILAYFRSNTTKSIHQDNKIEISKQSNNKEIGDNNLNIKNTDRLNAIN
jgi:hypothetical protein